MSSNIIRERFYQQFENHPATWQGIRDLLLEGNMEISKWGLMPGKDHPLGGCAGTVAWINEKKLFIFHAGDTLAILIRDGKLEQRLIYTSKVGQFIATLAWAKIWK